MEQEQAQDRFVVLAEGTIASDYALKSLSKALGEAQIEFAPAVKGEVNTYGGYKYTPLSGIVGAVRPALAKHHLTVSQFPVIDLESKTMGLYTRIVHWDSGEWMQNLCELPAELALGKGGTAVFNQQTIGGSQTYAQKYAYKAILGIPDSEEMIDSTEEKGDLPARSRRQPVKEQLRQAVDATAGLQAADATAPAGIRSLFFSKAKEHGWGLGDVKKLIVRGYPDANGSTAGLSEEQLSDLVKVMAENTPADVLAEAVQ